MIDSESLRNITPEELEDLGVGQMAYLLPVVQDDGHKTWFIKDADGGPLGHALTPALAKRACDEHGYVAVSVH